MLSNLRRAVQALFFLYIVGIGVRFIIYLNALNSGDMSASKPFGVEGFLPISALLGLKQLVLTFTYDRVHPAGLTIFIAIIVMSIVLKKSFCSHICPVGFIS
jgi:polyferredoxin